MSRDDMTPRHRMQTYYGYAFESWCTASRPDAPSGWGGDVDTNVQWCSVVKTKLGDNRMVIGGEVDCVRGMDSFDSVHDFFLTGTNKTDTMVVMTRCLN
jgi:RAT1-interacting protein